LKISKNTLISCCLLLFIDLVAQNKLISSGPILQCSVERFNEDIDCFSPDIVERPFTIKNVGDSILDMWYVGFTNAVSGLDIIPDSSIFLGPNESYEYTLVIEQDKLIDLHQNVSIHLISNTTDILTIPLRVDKEVHEVEVNFNLAFISLGQIQFENETVAEHITGYEWDFGDGNTSIEENPLHYYAANGQFLVWLHVMDTCGDIHSDLRGLNISGIDTMGIIHPNPASGIITISQESMIEKVDVYDMTGRFIFSRKNQVNSKSMFMEVYHLKPGQYILHIHSEEGLTVEKVSVKAWF